MISYETQVSGEMLTISVRYNEKRQLKGNMFKDNYPENHLESENFDETERNAH